MCIYVNQEKYKEGIMVIGRKRGLANHGRWK